VCEARRFAVARLQHVMIVGSRKCLRCNSFTMGKDLRSGWAR